MEHLQIELRYNSEQMVEHMADMNKDALHGGAVRDVAELAACDEIGRAHV